MKVYIAGPMTGYKDLNYPAFNNAEAFLVGIGLDVINPASNKPPNPITWEGFMKISIPQVCECDAVVTLPDWENSKGALVEVQIAKTLKLPVVAINETSKLQVRGS